MIEGSKSQKVKKSKSQKVKKGMGKCVYAIKRACGMLNDIGYF